jgi:hypothetical protein
VVWAVLAYRSERRYLSTALRTTAVVQSLRAERMERSTVYFPIISFTTVAGVPVTTESKTSRTSGYPIGQTLPVIYDPDHPDNVEIDAFWSRWLIVIGASFAALVLFGIGAAALLSR